MARKRFDYIILDTPPCSMLSDAAEAAELADCALLVLRQNYAPRERILEGAQLLTGGGLPLIGCVLGQQNVAAAGMLEGAVAALSGAQGELLGCVLNDMVTALLPDGGGYGYGYGYGRYGTYG